MHDAGKGIDRRNDSLHCHIGQRLHSGLARRKKRRACRWRLAAELAHDVGRRRQIIGLGETPFITFDESIEQPVTILFPGTLACHQLDGAQEPYYIDSGRASSGVVEVIEPPCILRYRELLDVRVAVQPHNWQVAQITAQIVAHPRDPGPVDEAEIIVRIGSKSLDQLGRRAFERFRVGSGAPRRAPCP